MENNILDNNGDIKLNVSGHVKMYHNGELFYDKPNTITLHTKRYLAETFYISNATTKLKGPSPHESTGTSLVSGVSASELNVNRANPQGETTPSINGKGGILISKFSASSQENTGTGNVINAMNTSVALTTSGTGRGRIIKFTGIFDKTTLNGTVNYAGAALAFSIRGLTGNEVVNNNDTFLASLAQSPAQGGYKATEDTKTYNSYFLVYDWLQQNGDALETLHNYNIERTTRPIAWVNNVNRELNAGDTLQIEWTITIN